ncbi:MAG: ribulose-phosphate 3-epimerase [Bacteroidales bacterium]|nr:ribulose-phosphate 3-epimerase [Bacteroidales bacterium]
MIKIAPSILSADLLKLKEQVSLIAENGADFIHVDVMDGHFVPNLTFGPNMVAALKRFVDIPLDVHLMIENPDKYIEDYINAGADILTVHQEACTHLHRTIQHIHQHGKKAGVSINPATPVSTIEDVICDVDLILIMSVNPGFGGQKFIERSLSKIKKVKELVDNCQRDIFIEVDGGVNAQTAIKIVESGADVLVAGNAIFKQEDMVGAMNGIKNLKG